MVQIYGDQREIMFTTQVLCGVDPVNDQSYILASMSADVLRRFMMSPGVLTKSEVRAIAAHVGLPDGNAAVIPLYRRHISGEDSTGNVSGNVSVNRVDERSWGNGWNNKNMTNRKNDDKDMDSILPPPQQQQQNQKYAKKNTNHMLTSLVNSYHLVHPHPRPQHVVVVLLFSIFNVLIIIIIVSTSSTKQTTPDITIT